MWVVGCNASRINEQEETWATNIELDSMNPPLFTYGTRINVNGSGFVGTELGSSRLLLKLRDRAVSESTYTQVSALLTRENRNHMTAVLPPNIFEQVCPFSSVDLVGLASLETVSVATGRVYQSNAIDVTLTCQREITPVLEGVPFRAMHLNDELIIAASGIFLTETEGQTYAVVSGCVLAEGVSGTCAPGTLMVAERPITVDATDPNARRNPSLIIGPSLVGLTPGFFEGSVYLRNETASGIRTESQSLALNVQLLDSSLDRINVSGSSLGGYIDFFGKGLVGNTPEEITSIVIQGTFEDQEGTVTPIENEVVTAYAGPNLVRYVLTEEDALGQTLKLRRRSGVVVATFQPILSYGSQERMLPELYSTFEVLPVRQIVHANYLPGFDDALERFGLDRAGELIKEQIIQRTTFIFSGIGVDVRVEAPDDFALYSQVDLTGFDPNGIGLMGYDNTPGKDVGNERLYDRIGGVHALTQEDGYPGYGGIFVESFFGFSKRPPAGIRAHPGASGTFDTIFNPLRPETGRPATRIEIEQFVPVVANQICLRPGLDRQNQVNCAIMVISNLIGSTMAHEIAHSLGLADPEGTLFHNPQPAANHLMDAGGDRPFEERAVLLDGYGEFFCAENYEYLRAILPTVIPDSLPNRTPCY